MHLPRRVVAGASLAMLSSLIYGCGGSPVLRGAEYSPLCVADSGECMGAVRYQSGPTDDESLAGALAEMIGRGFSSGVYEGGEAVSISVFELPKDKETGAIPGWNITCPADVREAADWSEATGKGVLKLCQVSGG